MGVSLAAAHGQCCESCGSTKHPKVYFKGKAYSITSLSGSTVKVTMKLTGIDGEKATDSGTSGTSNWAQTPKKWVNVKSGDIYSGSITANSQGNSTIPIYCGCYMLPHFRLENGCGLVLQISKEISAGYSSFENISGSSLSWFWGVNFPNH